MSVTLPRGKAVLKSRKSAMDVDRTNEEILDMCPIFRDWCEVRSQRLSSLFNDCIYRVQPHDYVTLDEKTLNKKPRQWRRSLPAIALYTHKRKYADPKVARARSRSASFMGAMAEQKLKTQLQYENEKEKHVNPYLNMVCTQADKARYCTKQGYNLKSSIASSSWQMPRTKKSVAYGGETGSNTYNRRKNTSITSSCSIPAIKLTSKKKI